MLLNAFSREPSQLTANVRLSWRSDVIGLFVPAARHPLPFSVKNGRVKFAEFRQVSGLQVLIFIRNGSIFF